MNKPKTIFAAAALAGLVVAAAGLATVPFNTSARAAAPHAEMNVASARIGVAFASLRPVSANPAIRAAAVRVSKGDLFAAPGCAGQTWPNIASDCLVKADGSRVSAVRTVTVGYSVGDNTTVLIRLPAAEASAR